MTTLATTVATIEVPEVIEAATCACGARAVVSEGSSSSCITCAVYEWMQPVEETAAPTYEERLCVECGGAYAPLRDVPDPLRPVRRGHDQGGVRRLRYGTDGIARSDLTQTSACGLCDVVFIPTTAVQRRGGLCAPCANLLYDEDPYQGYGAVAASYEALVRTMGTTPTTSTSSSTTSTAFRSAGRLAPTSPGRSQTCWSRRTSCRMAHSTTIASTAKAGPCGRRLAAPA